MHAIDESQADAAIQAVGEQYLTFLLGTEEYAVPILKVQEIKSWAPPTAVPCTPGYMLGVINLRGAIVPVFDLRRRFGLPPRDFTSTTAVIIARAEADGRQHVAGFVVDQVAEVYHLQEETIQRSADIAASINGDFIKGLTRTEEKLVIILNLDEILERSLDVVSEETVAVDE
ncbi:MAG: chemotaxis protein CheW [Gammaproteobacteria bacterium]